MTKQIKKVCETCKQSHPIDDFIYRKAITYTCCDCRIIEVEKELKEREEELAEIEFEEDALNELSELLGVM